MTLAQLKTNLKPMLSAADVKRYKNSYAEANGKIIALNLTGNDRLTSLVLDESASDLEFLYLSYNSNLSEVKIAAPLPHLELLYLNNCAFQHFSIQYKCLKLKQLYIEKQGFQEKKDDNKEQGQLQTLHIESGTCPALQFIEASNNQLRNFNLGSGFSNVAYLYLRYNNLETLQFGGLPALNILDLRGNQLEVLPILSYNNLETLYVKGNPLKDYTEKQRDGEASGNAAEIIGLLRAASASGTSINHRVKLIVVGNGRVGKTCLVNRLQDLPCKDGQKYTHGIVLTTINKQHLPNVKTDELELKIWDFGGQEVYYATHQFFMTEESAYVYAWTAEAIAKNNWEKDKIKAPKLLEDKFRPHSYWLDNIRMHSKASPLLVVKTHCDEVRELFPYENLKSDYALGINPLDFDAKGSERQLQNLRSEVTAMVNSLLGASIPNSYNAIIEAIETERQAPNNKNEITRTWLQGVAIKKKIEEKDFDSLLKYLKNTAGVIHYFDKAELKERIFINPDDLIAQVYKLIEENEHLKDEEGVFTAAYAVGKLGSEQWEVLLPLLLDFDLIYQKQSQAEITYIAPQYLPLLPTSGNALTSFRGHKTEKELRFTLKFPRFIPENIMVNVLSKYGPYATDTVYLNAIYFIKDKSKEGCLIECNVETREIEVYTSVNLEANHIAKEVYEKFIELSKKAEVHLSCNGGKEWAICKGLDTLEIHNDIPKVGGGIIQDKGKFGFLFEKEGLNRGGSNYSDEPMVENYKPMIEVKISAEKKNLEDMMNNTTSKSILFASANPDDTAKLKVGNEHRTINDELLKGSKRESLYFLQPQLEARITDLQRSFKQKPTIIHFSGHGEQEGIILSSDQNVGVLLNDAAINRLFKPLKGFTQLVLLNNCFSAMQAELISKYEIIVIGNNDAIGDDAAISFAKGLYLGLSEGMTYEDAFNDAMTTLLVENPDYADVIEVWYNGKKLYW